MRLFSRKVDSKAGNMISRVLRPSVQRGTQHLWRKFPNKNNHPHSWNAATSKWKTPFILCCRLISVPRKGRVSYCGTSPGPAYPPRQLDVLLHNGYPLGVDGAQVDILEEVHEEGLGGFLKSLDRL